MKKLLVLTVACLCASLVFFAFFGADRAASEKRTGSQESLEEIFSQAGDRQSVEVLSTRIEARPAVEIGAMPQEFCLCLWTSYSAVPDGQGCTVYIETIDQLCNPVPGNLTTATGFYLANAKKWDQYYAMGSVTWGYLPGLPTGWCWVLYVDYGWSGIPYLPDEYWFDRAMGYNHGDWVPPIQGYCGWPLATMPPDPFLVHCP
jgi:hypothetical protein